MTKNRIKLRDISSVAASSTVVINLPCGPRYHTVTLQHGYSAGTNTIAAAATNISQIRVKRNGTVQRTMSGTELRDMNLLQGLQYDPAGITGVSEVPNTSPGVSFTIYFAEPWRKDAKDQDALAWYTEGWQSFQIEVDLSSASTPTLIAYATTDNAKPAPGTVPGITKWIRQSFTFSGTSIDVTTIDRRDFLQQISLYNPGTGAIGNVRLKLDGQELHDLSLAAVKAINASFGMQPVNTGRSATIYDIVLDHDDLLGSAVPLRAGQDLIMTVDAVSTAFVGSCVAIIQRYGPPE